MARVKGGPVTRRRRNRVLKKAEGYWGKRKSSFRTAQEAVDRAEAYAYRDQSSQILGIGEAVSHQFPSPLQRGLDELGEVVAHHGV